MTRLTLIEDGDPVGYVDTDTLETEYTGSEEDVAILIDEIEEDGVNVGPPADNPDGPDEYLEGEALEEYVRNLADTSAFEVRA